MKPQHTFQTKCHNLPDLFNVKINTLSKFMCKLEEQSKIDPVRYDSDKYKGDGFEFFIELLLHTHSVDNRIGIYKYLPQLTNDNGVDGTGLNIKGEKCVVQIKYRSNNKEILSSNKDHLANLFSDGMLNHDVVYDNSNDKNYRHFLFTTAKGLHFYTDQEMFKSRLKCFGYKEIKQLVDNNYPFWDTIRAHIKTIEHV